MTINKFISDNFKLFGTDVKYTVNLMSDLNSHRKFTGVIKSITDKSLVLKDKNNHHVNNKTIKFSNIISLKQNLFGDFEILVK